MEEPAPEVIVKNRLKASRFYIPLVISAVLFALYRSFLAGRAAGSQSLIETIFGPRLSYLLFAALVPLIFFLVRAFDALTFDLLFSRRRGVVVPLLLREIVSVTLYLFLFGTAISTIFNRSISGLLVGTTVLAAVIGLALQDTLGNLFAGISLHIERPFDVGDVLRSGDLIGIVEGVNWRATRMRTPNDSYVVLPNSVLARDRIEVFPSGSVQARIVTIGANYDTPPSKVIYVTRRAVGSLEGVAQHPQVVVRVASFGESSVVYDVKYWTPVYAQRDDIDAAVRKAVWYAFRRNNISIPFPMRTIQHYEPRKPDSGLSIEEVRERIDTVELLGPLSDEEREMIAGQTVLHTYSHGETIIRHGEVGDSMFVVHEGRVSVRIVEGTATKEIAKLGAGSIFGEMALLTGESRAASVIAETEVVALEIGKSSLHPILSRNPSLAFTLSSGVIERRMRNTAAKRDDLDDEEKSIGRRIRAWFGV